LTDDSDDTDSEDDDDDDDDIDKKLYRHWCQGHWVSVWAKLCRQTLAT